MSLRLTTSSSPVLSLLRNLPAGSSRRTSRLSPPPQPIILNTTSPTFHRQLHNHRTSSSSTTPSSIHTKTSTKTSTMVVPTLPPSSWDAHMHITDPSTFPPPSTSAQYTPHAALLPAALSNASSLSLPNLILVQPSTYGTDNACLLSALHTLGPSRARGIVVLDPATITQTQLQEWHDLGVRGVRVNLKSVGKELSAEDLASVLQAHADICRPLGWALQVYADMHALRGLASLMPALGVKVVVDHLGSPGRDLLADDKARQASPAWQAFIEFLVCEGAFVKVSAPYRVAGMEGEGEGWKELEGLVRELLGVREGRAVVFASDWPHTRFEGVSVDGWVGRCWEWCGGDEGRRERLFRGNAEVLFGVEGGGGS